MTDRVYPSTKPAANGGGGVPAATTANPANPAGPTKPQLYRPYQPSGHHRRRARHDGGGRCNLCCCCFWTILLVLALALLAAITGATLYVLYRPHRPEFSLSALRIGKLNLTSTSTDSASARLTTLFNLTVTSKNPNNHFTFTYDSFLITFSSSSNSVFLGNGSFPAFTSGKKNETVLRAVVSASSQDVDTDSATSLRSDLKRKNGVPIKIQMDTRVMVSAGKLKSKKVGIRVSCEGIKGVVAPTGKSPSVATMSDTKCKVDLRIKIWKFTF